jgi:phage-related protein
MADLELPAYRPVYPISKNVRPRQTSAKLPSSWGTEQRGVSGRNQTAPEWNVKWILEDPDANVLDAFLHERARNNETFIWSPPGYPQARYRCESWTKTLFDVNVSDIQATFKRIYDYNNLPSINAGNGHCALDGYNVKFRTDFYIAANSGIFELNELLIDEFSGTIDSLNDFDEAYEIGASLKETHIMYPAGYQLILVGNSISVQSIYDQWISTYYEFDPFPYEDTAGLFIDWKSPLSITELPSTYFADMSSQMFGWEALAYVEWWGN